MVKPIIIQGALQCEIDYLLQCFNLNKKTILGSYVFYECTYNNYPIIISKTKMGEISGAIATTLAILTYNPLLILNQGTAGASVEWLNKGDIVVGKQIYYISQFSTEKNKETDDVNPWKKDEYRTADGERISYKANNKLLNTLKGLKALKKSNIYFDVIGSGDIWTKKKDKIEELNKNYNIVCEAMECSGAYMAANSLGIPLISIRVISNNEIKKQPFDEKTAVYAQKIITEILDELLEII